MKIEEILKKQGELYKDLRNNKTIEEYNETIEKPEPVKLVEYKGNLLLKKEYGAIKALEKLLGIEPVIVNEPAYVKDFEILVEDNKVIYLRITDKNLKQIPEQINNLQNIQILWLYKNQITKIKNLDNLRDLRELDIHDNKIKKIENLNNLQNLQTLYLNRNKIKEIKNLDNLPNLKELWLGRNPIKNKEKAENLRNKGVIVYL